MPLFITWDGEEWHRLFEMLQLKFLFCGVLVQQIWFSYHDTMSLSNHHISVAFLQAQLQAALSEKEEWQQKAIKFEDTCETLRVLSWSEF